MEFNKLIKTEQEYNEALKRLSEIFQADPDTAEGMEAELLVTLISKYEEEHYPIELPDPIEAIKESMYQRGLKDKDLAPAIGNKSAVSHILNRRRHLTIDMIRSLSEFLKIPLEVLIQPYELNGKQEQETA